MELQPLIGRYESSITLANLPQDIIRILIREVGPPVETMKLIGHSWNAMVAEYLADRKNNPPLGEVFVRYGGPEEEKRVKISIAVTQPSHKHHFRRMCRKSQWKNIVDQPDTFVSPILQLRTIELSRRWQIIVAVYFILAVCAVAFRLHYSVSILIVLLTLALLVYLFIIVRPKTKENRDCVSTIFARCSTIEELSIIHLNRETLDVVRETLGDVPIKNLIVYDRKCDAGLREKIAKMAGTHNIEKITVCAKRMNSKKLRKFYLSVTETANELQIYESSEKDDIIFGKPRDFWVKQANELNDGSVSVQVMNGEQDDHLREGSQRFRLKILF